MVFRSLCCCTAATTEAVVVHPKHAETLSTTRREERRPSVSSSSAASSIGLAYLDAVEDDVTENGSKRGSMGDLFFDAEEALESENFDFQVKSEKDQSVNGQSLHDEALLAPNLRDGGHRRARIEALDKGFPGSLTEHQLKAYQKFRSELQRRDQIYRDMVYAFSHVEPEAYALCRFLRFCNFHVEKTFHYMDRHTSKWEEAAKCDFYPDSQKAVGAPMSVLLTQFPSLYFGNARAGYPVCYFRAENLSEEGIECITNLDRLPNVIWFSVMNHLRHKMYPKAQEIDPSFVRLEQITVMNLEGLSPSLFTPKIYSVLKRVDDVSNVFPEMLHTLLVINAPSFFTFVWSVIKRFLDVKTTSIIQIYSSKAKAQERLLELIDQRELPSDYGGSALSTSELILREGRKGRIPQYQIVELMKVRKKRPAEIAFSLKAGEKIDLCLYTRSNVIVDFTLSKDRSEVVTKPVKPAETLPHRFHFGEYEGPGKYTLTADSAGDASPVQHFLLIGEVFGGFEI